MNFTSTASKHEYQENPLAQI